MRVAKKSQDVEYTLFISLCQTELFPEIVKLTHSCFLPPLRIRITSVFRYRCLPPTIDGTK